MNATVIPENQIGETFDLLNRQDFVDRILQVAETLSRNKKNACYAVNGAWGSGKSFVMDMFEKQAKEIYQGDIDGEKTHELTTLPRYLVFHYNCWEYDYYEEPLIAIVITMLDAIDKSVNLLDSETKAKIKEILKIVAQGFGKKVIETIEEKTGVNIQETVETVSKGVHEAKEEVKNDFDPYYDFKKSLKKLQKTVASLSENQTVIFVVDELDRCLPEYAIKVLERLHHLFTGIPNVQVILSIDKKQLEHTVQQIYGTETDVNKYLAKFISFEIELSSGSFDDGEKLSNRFRDYYQKFRYIHSETAQTDVNEFCKLIFEGVDIRSRVEIFEKCSLIHGLLEGKTIANDYSVMCIEILLTTLKSLNVKTTDVRSSFDGHFIRFPVSGKGLNDCYVLQAVTQKYSDRTYCKIDSTDSVVFWNVLGDSIWGATLAAYLTLGSDYKIRFVREHNYYAGEYSVGDIIRYTKLYWDFLNILQ